MEPYTMDRGFHKQEMIDGFSSCIWTERYYGDCQIELVVPPTTEMIAALPEGTFVGLIGSDRVMMIETVNMEEGKLKATGTSLEPWLNNRFIRVTANHEDRYWYISGMPAGRVMWEIVYAMCIAGSPYLSGVINIGIDNPERLAIPGLLLRDFDASGPDVNIGVPYGPVYDALKQIATTYEIGMQLTLDAVFPTSFNLGFRTFKGLDRTSDQSVNPVVRFSPQMESFTDIKELRTIAAMKTLIYAFAPGLKPAEGDPDLRTVPGKVALTGPEYTGFDLRAMMIFADDITTDQVGADPANVVSVLNNRALLALTENRYMVAVDGEIVPESQFKYGVHYSLGDIIEVQGNSGVIQTARVTEYIRAQDAAGERAYPSVTMIG